jgi:GTP cyclohydrolase II
VTSSSSSGLDVLFGSAQEIAVERGLAEFKSGRPIVVSAGERADLAIPVDGMNDARLASFRRLCAPAEPHLVVTSQRARALGLDAAGPVGLAIGAQDGAEAILALAASAGPERTLRVVPVSITAGAAIELAKVAQRLPALLMAESRAPAVSAAEFSPVEVGADAVRQIREAATASLAIVAEASVPLTGGLQTRFVVFRDEIGGSSVAVMVGRPDLARPVPVRLHSACLTGDVFGSRRCDCGDQLRLAVARLEQEGGGIVLYLDQEGRGLGLANKMRAYALQDAGLDTIDANAALGFDDDERDYGVAGRMLRLLGCKQVRLLTNNPAKLDGLAHAGVEVVSRVPLHGPVNADNRRYLTAKATRAGHKLDHLLSALAEPAEPTPQAAEPRRSR